MSTLQDIVHVGNSGLMAQQQLMSTVSQNISNSATKGYHRRTSVLGTVSCEPTTLYNTSKAASANGVTVTNVMRAYNATQEAMLSTAQSNQEYHTQKGAALTDLQSLLSGTSTSSLDTDLQSFWSGWQAVATNPTDPSARSALLENGSALASTFRDMSTQLATFRTNLASLDGSSNPIGTIPDVVADINAQASQIQSLNRTITLAGPGSNAGTNSGVYDLLDQRDTLIGQLSKSADISMAADGTVTLGGQILVSGDGKTSNTLTVTNTTGPVTFDLGGTAVTPGSGDLAAWTDAATAVDDASTKLDTLANALITGVNTLTTSGFDMNGNPGVAFFTGLDASTIAMNPAIHDPANPSHDAPTAIAAGATSNAADGKIAQRIADLSNATLLNGQTLSAQYNNQLSQLGAAIQSETQSTTSATHVVEMLTNSIQQNSGVSTDEEMINMITSQRAYQAAAKMVSTTDSMMTTVLSMVGGATAA